MNRIARRTAITLLLSVLLVAGLAFFLAEFAFEAEDWVLFEGSPHVYNGSSIGCGSVTDREGQLLLDMEDGRVYAESAVLRMSTVHWLGDRNGNISAPALTHYSAELSGFDLLNGVYSYGETSAIATLTLSAKAQIAALEALGDAHGTVAVYNYETGELLCAVSTPTFDPNDPPQLSEDNESRYDGLYVNRFTQGRYIPGSIFKIVTLAAALETRPELLDQNFVCTGSYAIGADEIVCEDPHWDQSLKDAFRNSCNCAFAQISQILGQNTLQRYVDQFAVNAEMTFDGITTTEGNFDLTDAEELSAAWSSIGQHKDLINPCAFLQFVGAVAREGKGVQPYIVEEIRIGGTSTYRARSQTRERIMSASTAQTVKEFMRNNVQTKYGDENFPGLNVCAKTGTAEVGADKKPNAMLAGFVDNPDIPLAFIVCVENGGYGSTTCIPIASKVLAVCADGL